MIPLARTNAEAHLFMDIHPCGCGETAFERTSAVVTRGEDLCSQYTGPCPSCGTVRTFVFRIPETVMIPIPGQVKFGGDEPSELLDPGVWMAVSEDRARRMPTTRVDLATAIAALEEVLKFIPPGLDRVPPEAFVSPGGKLAHAHEPGRFRKIRIEAVLGAYRKLLAGL